MEEKRHYWTIKDGQVNGSSAIRTHTANQQNQQVAARSALQLSAQVSVHKAKEEVLMISEWPLESFCPEKRSVEREIRKTKMQYEL